MDFFLVAVIESKNFKWDMEKYGHHMGSFKYRGETIFNHLRMRGEEVCLIFISLKYPRGTQLL